MPYALTPGAAEHEVDPVSRIEGHLGVKVSTDAGGNIIDANAHGNLWRGFENFLLGRDINDAITFVQRICGVCPVPHGMTSTYAVDTVLGYSAGHITFKYNATDGKGVPAKAVLIRNLVLGSEFLMSSITHFYHLAAPSYIQGPAIPPWTPFFNDAYYTHISNDATMRNVGNKALPDANPATLKLWDAVIISYVRALKIRRMTFEAGALFAGRMPMTSCYVGGGVTNDGTENLTQRINKFVELTRVIGKFIVNEYVPIALALGALYTGFDNKYNSDPTNFKPVGSATNAKTPIEAKGFGGGLGRFLAWGAFPSIVDDSLALPGGIYDATGVLTNFTVVNKAEVKSKFLAGGTNAVPDNLTEDISHSRYGISTKDQAAYAAHGNNAAYPGAVTRTKPARSNGYSYMKAPRWAGQPCEVGPFARLAVAGYYPVDGRLLAKVVPGYLSVYTTADMATLDSLIASDTPVPNSVFKAGAVDPVVVAGLTNSGLLSTVIGWVLNLRGGLSTMDRLRGRALESLVLVQAMVGSITTDAAGVISWANDGWAQQLAALTGDASKDTVGSTWRNLAIPAGTTQGWGATEAPRGALMHQAKITNGKIVAYQCIVPTTWNGSPKDAAGKNGAIESACIGAPFANQAKVITGQNGTSSISAQGGVEVLRIAQSFDPCIACAIH